MADTSSDPNISLNNEELAKLAAALLAELEKHKQFNAVIVAETKRKAGELINAVHKVAASHSGSNFGYHGALYYRGFEIPSLSSMFNVEWGGIHGIPAGWVKREPDEIKLRIEALSSLTFLAVEEAVKDPLDSAKHELQEILIQLAPLHRLADGNREKQILQALERFDWKDSAHNDYAVAALKGYPNMTRDSGAFSQGIMFTSHDYYGAVATQVQKSCQAIEEFWASAERLLKQLAIRSKSKLVTQHDAGDNANLAVKYERLREGALVLAALSLSMLIAAAAEYAIRKWRWEWLLSHPNSYSIQWLTCAVLLLFSIGLFVRRFRNYCWGFALVPIFVGVLQLCWEALRPIHIDQNMGNRGQTRGPTNPENRKMENPGNRRDVTLGYFPNTAPGNFTHPARARPTQARF